MCTDGQQGWLAYQKGKFDLLLLDVMMPLKDGFTLVNDIRSSQRMPRPGRGPGRPADASGWSRAAGMAGDCAGHLAAPPSPVCQAWPRAGGWLRVFHIE